MAEGRTQCGETLRAGLQGKAAVALESPAELAQALAVARQALCGREEAAREMVEALLASLDRAPQVSCEAAAELHHVLEQGRAVGARRRCRRGRRGRPQV